MLVEISFFVFSHIFAKIIDATLWQKDGLECDDVIDDVMFAALSTKIFIFVI